jgi:hypothetical protein
MLMKQSTSGGLRRLLLGALAVILTLAFTPLMPGSAGGASAATVNAAPTVFYGTGTKSGRIKLTWSKVKGVKSYTVYRGGKKLKTTGNTSYTDKKTKKNRVYSYQVRAKGGKKSWTIQVKASNKGNVGRIRLSAASLSLKTGASQKLKVKLTPSRKPVSKKIVWTTSDARTATVSAGTVTAKASGSATITARTVNGRTAQCRVKIITANPAKADIDALTGKIDESFARQVSETLAYDDKYFTDESGFRNAGSDAEHKAASYLARTFDRIGLSNVEKVPVTVDKWQYNGSSLTLTYNDQAGSATPKKVMIDDMVSYAAQGTKQDSRYKNGTVKDWSDMEIVDMGSGHEEDYEAYYEKTGAKDMGGRIVLVGVNQMEDAWVTSPYLEAYDQNASAIITYQLAGDSGYGLLGSGNEETWDTVNIQDICADGTLIPCTSISPKSAAKIKKAIKEGGSTLKASLMVDNEVAENGGTSYNVIGRIKGSGNTGQRIIIAGHYDKYFYGLNDDCTAIGLVAAIGKAMVDSGYQPVNDIYFVAHGSEEWGQMSSADDWAIGSWEMITKAKPEWKDSTLAMLNFEMPAIASGQTSGYVQTSAELGTPVNQYLQDTDLLAKLKPYYKDGVSTSRISGTTLFNEPDGMSDCISYQSSGVPSVINLPDFHQTLNRPIASQTDNWLMDRCHTKYDNSTTYSSSLMQYNIGFYGGLAEYLDARPALELDLSGRTAAMKAAIEGTGDCASDGRTAVAKYNEGVEALEKAGSKLLAKAKEINQRYEKAYNRGASATELAQIRAEGTKLNKTTLEVFGDLQDSCMGLVGSDISVLHQTVQPNIEAIDTLLPLLQDGSQDADKVLGTAAAMYGYAEATAFSYGNYTCEELIKTINCEYRKDTWGYGSSGKESLVIPDTWKTAKEMMAACTGEGTPDYSAEITAYQKARTGLVKQLDQFLEMETSGMNKAAEKVNAAL